MKKRSNPDCRFLSGPYSPLALFALLAAAILFWIPSGALAQAGEPDHGDDGMVIIDPPEFLPCPTLRAESITAAGAAHQDLKLHFPWWLHIDRESLGDGDIVVSGPGGYLQRGQLVNVAELVLDFPHPRDSLADELVEFPQAGPVLVATYRVFPPSDSRAWTAAHNGSYAVKLVEGEVLGADGAALAPKLLGGFRVAIRPAGEPTPIQPVDTRIHIGHRPADGLFAGEPDPDFYYATVQLFFDAPHVDVEFLELRRERNSFVANVNAVKLPISDPGDVPIIGPDGVLDRQMVLTLRTKIYRLGDLDPGEYRFIVRVNAVREGLEEFVVHADPPGDREAPHATLQVRNITTPGGQVQRLQVVYEDRSGVDLSTVGDGDLVVLSPCIFLDIAPPFPCEWEAQRARFVEVVSASDDLKRVVALYEIDGPASGWSAEHNGFYPVVWSAGEVCDRVGNCNREARLGGFEVAIRPDVDPPVPAEAELRVDASNPDMVAAKVHIQFKQHWGVVDQGIRRDGNRIILEAKAVPLPVIAIFPPPPPPSEDLLYEIGPLREGAYIAVFMMNGHVYDAEELRVERSPEPPIPAEVALEVDASDPDNVFALVKIQFRTPHRVEQGEVRREGSRIVLPARAEPLPIRENAPAVLPEPVRLRFPIGELPAGGYLAVFVMNEFPYAAERFMIDDPGPPIDAEVGIEVLTENPDAVVARVKVRFASPHVIDSRDIHRRGNHFILEATARPVRPAEDPNDIDRNTVILEYPLGSLEAGAYGAVFVMNGFPYEDADFVIRRSSEFEAEVALGVDASDPSAVKAKASILFENPYVVIENPGTPRRDGNRVIIDATAVVAPGLPGQVAERIDLGYDLGAFRPGEYILVYKINGNAEARALFRIDDAPPIPAEARLAVEVSGTSATAHAHIQFRDHYRIVGQELTRQGTRFIIDLKVDGPLPLAAPIPPAPIELTIPLGHNLADGNYIAGLRMNGYLYAHDEFRIHHDPFAVEVAVEVGKSDDGYKAGVVVDFKNPYVLITDAGEPVRHGNVFEIHATAEEVVFVQEPSGDPQRFSYDLGNPEPGSYGVIYYINGRAEGHARFRVAGDPEPPVAHIAGIEISQGDASWFADVGVLLLPGQRVTDWGVVRQSQNEFHVNITVDWVDFPHGPDVEPIDPRLVPDGVQIVNAAGDALIGDAPVRLVRHQYVLGVLEAGEYRFLVHSRGQTVARKGFAVPGEGRGPEAILRADNITEPSERPQRFSISYSDPDGLDHESIQLAPVIVTGPHGFEQMAALQEYASTDDVPSTGAIAAYTVIAPGGSWDPRDNGRYCVHVNPLAIRDLNGNTLENGRLGCFYARMDIDPPHNDTQVRVDVALVEDQWVASVEIIPATGTTISVQDWGEVLHHGQTHLALATVTQEHTPNGPIAEPLAHRYPLGALRPGSHVFVFKTNLAHCGIKRFRVPGMEGDPIDNWRDAAGVRDGEDDADGDRHGLVAEYFFAMNPRLPDAPRVNPEIVIDQHGDRHLALRFRRLLAADGVRQVIEASRDLRHWQVVDAETEVVEQEVDIDGTEELLVCLRERLGEDSYRWMRIRLVREEE